MFMCGFDLSNFSLAMLASPHLSEKVVMLYLRFLYLLPEVLLQDLEFVIVIWQVTTNHSSAPRRNRTGGGAQFANKAFNLPKVACLKVNPEILRQFQERLQLGIISKNP
jgi:hypothetical protein